MPSKSRSAIPTRASTCRLPRARRGRLLHCAALTTAAAAGLLASRDVSAVNRTWIGSSSTWSGAVNWNPNGVPGAADNLTIAQGLFTLTLDANAANPTVTGFTIDNNMALSHAVASQTLTYTSSAIIGNNSIGTYTISAGTFTNAGVVGYILGNNPAGSGRLVISSAGTVKAAFGIVGESGTGTVVHSGGSHLFTGGLLLGDAVGSVGTYSFTGGTLSTLTTEVGFNGAGTFNQSGASSVHAVSGTLTIGGSGNYNLINGTLSATTILNRAGGSRFSWTGGGTFTYGTLRHDNGTVALSGSLYQPANNSTYQMAAGTLSTNEFAPGAGGPSPSTGTFSMTGGTASMGTLSLGRNANGVGTASLTGGTLTVGTQIVGGLGTGVLNHTAGTNLPLTLSVADDVGSIGAYTLSGAASLSVTGEMRLGRRGSGTLTQTGGFGHADILGLGGNFTAGVGAGTASISGGTFTTHSGIIVGDLGAGTLLQTGGALSAGDEILAGAIIVGNSPTGPGRYDLSGGSLTIINPSNNLLLASTGYQGGAGTINLSGTASITVNASESVGQDGGFGTFIQSGSSLHLVSNRLEISANGGVGTYLLQGGNLSVGSLQINPGSTFTQTGGSVQGQVIQGGGVYTLGGGVLYGNAYVLNGGTLVAGNGINASEFDQNGGTISGTFRNAGTFVYNAGSFTAQLVNLGAVLFGADCTVGGGIENDSILDVDLGRTVTSNGPGLDNFGVLNLNGGVLAGTALVNDFGGEMNARGTITAPFTNNGVLGPTGLLTVSSAADNNGVVNAIAGNTIRFNGGLSNNAAGIIQGGGLISGPITNNGGMIFASSASPLSLTTLSSNTAGGELRVADASTLNITNAFSSSGVITLGGPNAMLTGGTLTNNGLISGTGRVANRLVNNGVIRAESGGQLTLSASNSLNNAAGQIQASTGNTVFFSSGLPTNAGFISLTGGAFDNNNVALANTNHILGRGTIRTGGLNNTGTVNLADGNSDVFGAVTNAGTINLTSGTFTFFNFVNNSTGRIKTTAAVARYLAGASVGGTYISDPSDNYFTDLTVTASGVLVGGTGDRFFISGNFTNASAQPGAWDTSLAQLHFQGGGTHAFNVAGAVGQFGWGSLTIAAGNTVNVNGNSATAEATGNAGALVQTSGASNVGDLAGAGDTTVLAPASLRANHIRQHVLSIAGTASLATNGSTSGTSKVQSLSITAAGALDLNNNDLVVGADTTMAAIENYVRTSRNNGAWDQPGLTSSAARTNPSHSTGLGVISGSEFTNFGGGSGAFSGQSYAAPDTLVKYTWNGDANIDGRVTFDDYVRIDVGFNTQRTGWVNGDFNYSGAVNFDDYVLIDIAFNTQNGSLARAIDWISGDDRSATSLGSGVDTVIDHFGEFGAGYGAAFLAAVPEPCFLGAIVPIVSMFRRARRSRRR